MVVQKEKAYLKYHSKKKYVKLIFHEQKPNWFQPYKYLILPTIKIMDSIKNS